MQFQALALLLLTALASCCHALDPFAQADVRGGHTGAAGPQRSDQWRDPGPWNEDFRGAIEQVGGSWNALQVQSPLVNYTSDVFLEKEDDIATYRIPSVVQISHPKTGPAILLAFAEARKSSSSDCGRKSVVVKSSTDMGRTWSKMRNVYGLDVDKIVAGNQMVAVDESTNTVFCHFSTSPVGVACSPSKCNWQTSSSDGGETWSKPANISAVMGPYLGVSPGPGDALQLTKVKPGRLIFAGHYGAYREDIVWCSDDHGETYWRPNVTFPKMDEATLTQLANGSVLLNMRNAHVNECKCRGVSRSDDGGETWTAIRYDAALVSPVCEAALAQIGERLYFSNPASTTSRENLTVRVSDDGGSTWIAKTLLVQGGSVWGGYSSLVPAELGQVGSGLGGVLYERYSSGKQAISFSAFPLDFDKL